MRVSEVRCEDLVVETDGALRHRSGHGTVVLAFPERNFLVRASPWPRPGGGAASGAVICTRATASARICSGSEFELGYLPVDVVDPWSSGGS